MWAEAILHHAGGCEASQQLHRDSVSLHSSGTWERDLDTDLDALVKRWDAQVLVSLLEPGDLRRLKIPDLAKRAEAYGLEVINFPMRDVSVPHDRDSVRNLVAAIGERICDGKNVVVHCEGGLGRSGIIAGCHLAAHMARALPQSP